MEFRELIDTLQSRVRLNPEEEALIKQRKQNSELIAESTEAIGRLSSRVVELEAEAQAHLRDWSIKIEKELVERMVGAATKATVKLQQGAMETLQQTASTLQKQMQQQAAEFVTAMQQKLHAVLNVMDETLAADVEHRQQVSDAAQEKRNEMKETFQTLLGSMQDLSASAFKDIDISAAALDLPQDVVKDAAVEEPLVESGAIDTNLTDLVEDMQEQDVVISEPDTGDIATLDDESGIPPEDVAVSVESPESAEFSEANESDEVDELDSLLADVEGMTTDEATGSETASETASDEGDDELDALLADVESMAADKGTASETASGESDDELDSLLDEIKTMETDKNTIAEAETATPEPDSVVEPPESSTPSKHNILQPKPEDDWTEEVIEEIFGHEKELDPEEE